MASQAPAEPGSFQDRLSPWWRRSVLAVMVIGFTVLILLTIKVHYDAPPIPDEVVDPRGTVLFSKSVLRATATVPDLRLWMVEAAALAWVATFLMFALFLIRLFLSGREAR